MESDVPKHLDAKLLASWNDCTVTGEVRDQLAIAERFMSVAKDSDRTDILVGHLLLGAPHFYAGRATEARRHFEMVVSEWGEADQDNRPAQSVHDQQAAAKGMLASVLCFQGLHGRVMELTREAVADVLRGDHTLSICEILGGTAIPNALYTSHLDEAETYAQMLHDRAKRNGPDQWRNLAEGLDGVLRLQRGDIEGAASRLAAACADINYGAIRYMPVLCAWCRALMLQGKTAEGLALADTVIHRLEETGQGWYRPEFYRSRGNLLIAAASHPDDIITAFEQSLQLSEQMGALTWRLRTAVDFSEYLASLGHHSAARGCLHEAIMLFGDAGGSKPVQAAQARLDAWG